VCVCAPDKYWSHDVFLTLRVTHVLMENILVCPDKKEGLLINYSNVENIGT